MPQVLRYINCEAILGINYPKIVRTLREANPQTDQNFHEVFQGGVINPLRKTLNSIHFGIDSNIPTLTQYKLISLLDQIGFFPKQIIPSRFSEIPCPSNQRVTLKQLELFLKRNGAKFESLLSNLELNQKSDPRQDREHNLSTIYFESLRQIWNYFSGQDIWIDETGEIMIPQALINNFDNYLKFYLFIENNKLPISSNNTARLANHINEDQAHSTFYEGLLKICIHKILQNSHLLKE